LLLRDLVEADDRYKQQLEALRQRHRIDDLQDRSNALSEAAGKALGEVADLTERLIDRIDEIDGDPDMEEDDPSGQCDEDGITTGIGSFVRRGARDDGPGCPISDPGGEDEL